MLICIVCCSCSSVLTRFFRFFDSNRSRRKIGIPNTKSKIRISVLPRPPERRTDEKNRWGAEIRNKSESEFPNLASLPRKPIQARTRTSRGTFLFLKTGFPGIETQDTLLSFLSGENRPRRNGVRSFSRNQTSQEKQPKPTRLSSRLI